MPDGFKIDLAAYADRIGLSNDLEPTIDCLHKIAMGHATSVPFEHLSVLQKEPIHLGPPELESKLVRRWSVSRAYRKITILSLKPLA